MSKHTPGPWVVEYDNDESGHVIRMGTAIKSRGRYSSHHIIIYCHDVYPDDGNQFEEAEANANLIAVAPDMLEALKIAIDRLDDGSAWSDEHLYELEAVVAKAEGSPAE